MLRADASKCTVPRRMNTGLVGYSSAVVLRNDFGQDRDVSSTMGHSADQFAAFFARKIDDVRRSTANLSPPPVQQTTTSSLTTFRECTSADVRRLIMKSPVKSCSLEPVPTFLVREFVDVLLPYLTSMVNASLQQSRRNTPSWCHCSRRQGLTRLTWPISDPSPI